LENGKCLIIKSAYRNKPETVVNKKSLNFYHSFNFQKNEHLLHQIVNDAFNFESGYLPADVYGDEVG